MDENSAVFACLLPLMRAKGVQVSPQAFHQAVNVAFHNGEATVYDSIHQGMWAGLPQQFQLLSAAALQTATALPARLRALDIGCGTGLSAAALLQTPLGARVTELDLLDTSPAMLARATERAAGWGIPYRVIEGDLTALAEDHSYDLVVVCSVLHHIPDVAAFLAAVRTHQPGGGLLLHVQDPNGDYLQDAQLQQRMADLQRRTRSPLPRSIRRLSPARVVARLYREVTHRQTTDYIATVNAHLLAAGIITLPLTAAEIWSVTDIHVDNLPFSWGDGIRVQTLTDGLGDYTPLALRSYAFFGVLQPELPPDLQPTEATLIAQHAMNGKYLGGIWQRSHSVAAVETFPDA